MKERLRFTKNALDAIKPAAKGKRAYYWDDEVPGLQLAVTDKGTKSFYLYKKISGKPVRQLIGHYPDLHPAKARSLAYQKLASLAEGINPETERQKKTVERLTLNDAFEMYIEAKRLKESTIYDYRNLIKTGLATWKNKHLISISPNQVTKMHQQLGDQRGPVYANGAMRLFRAIYNFARMEYEDERGQSLLPENPVRKLSQNRSWYRQKRKTSVIHADQMPQWFAAVEELRREPVGTMAQTVGDYLLVLVLTGLRRSEAAKLTWDRVDLERAFLKIEDTKNHVAHELPLSDFLLELLKERKAFSQSEYVFPGKESDQPIAEPRPQIRKVVNASGITFTPHDLRRTFSTIAEAIGIPIYTLKRLLNHKMSGDVTAGYVVSDLPQLRGPMQQITDKILECSGYKQTANVTKIYSKKNLNNGRK